MRLNAATHNGGTAINDEDAKLGLLAVGLDWRSRDVRLSGDLGWQDHQLKRTRTNVTLGAGVTSVPTVPGAQSSHARRWG